MCLLTYFPENIQPDPQALREGSRVNDDGHGFAIVTGNRIRVGKSMDFEKALADFQELRERFPEGPALFHSRYGTHGTNTVDNVHPFRVRGDDKTVIGHNGVFPELVQPAKGDNRSDTRILAEDKIYKWGALHREETHTSIEEWMTRGNKIVILTVNPRFAKNGYILNESSGTWDNGVWYSNDGYKPWATRYGSLRAYTSYPDWQDDAEGSIYRPSRHGRGWVRTYVGGSQYRETWQASKCWQCDQELTSRDHSLGECPMCGFCLDCNSSADICQCLGTGSYSTRNRTRQTTTLRSGLSRWRKLGMKCGDEFSACRCPVGTGCYGAWVDLNRVSEALIERAIEMPTDTEERKARAVKLIRLATQIEVASADDDNPLPQGWLTGVIADLDAMGETLPSGNGWSLPIGDRSASGKRTASALGWLKESPIRPALTVGESSEASAEQMDSIIAEIQAVAGEETPDA